MNKLTNLKKIGVLIIITFLLGPNAGLCAARKKSAPGPTGHFFAFDDADYHTSPDKRIGAKILVDPAKVGPSISSMVHLTYLPGAHIGSHRHVYVTELIYVLEGNLTLRIGEEVKILGPNSSAHIPAKAFHEYLNDSADVVKFLQYYSPSGPEEEYRNWSKAGETKVSATTPQEPKQIVPETIVTPTLPPVPGSPETKIDEVKEANGESSTKAVIDSMNFDSPTLQRKN